MNPQYWKNPKWHKMKQNRAIVNNIVFNILVLCRVCFIVPIVQVTGISHSVMNTMSYKNIQVDQTTDLYANCKVQKSEARSRIECAMKCSLKLEYPGEVCVGSIYARIDAKSIGLCNIYSLCGINETSKLDSVFITVMPTPPEPSYYFPMNKIQNNYILGSIDGLLFGNPQLQATTFGNSLYLNGIDQYVSLGNHRDKCLGNLEICTDGITVSFWTKFGTKSAVGKTLYILSGGGQTSSSHGIAIFRKTSKLGLNFSTTSKAWKNWDLMTVEDLIWYHFTFTWDIDNGVSFYLNGCLLLPIPSYTSRSLSSTVYNDIFIGSGNKVIGDQNYLAELYIADMRVFNKVISPLNIAVYNVYRGII